ncbi:MAG: major capsid protein [Janthinobacterium lividum]
MPLPLYGTATLMGLFTEPLNQPPPPFWLNFFPNTFNSNSDTILFDDVDVQERRLAPFVAPNVQGRYLRSRGFSTKSFKPAYLKPKHVVDPSRSRTRRPGEPLLGNLSQMDRHLQIVADNMRVENQVIQNRLEHMACSGVVNGYVDVIGDDYPTSRVDYGRDPSLTITLSGASLWSQATATPLIDIQTGRNLAFKLGRAPVSDLVMGTAAYEAFSQTNHPDVQLLLSNQRAGGNSSFNTTPFVDVNGLNANVASMGTIQGINTPAIRLWVYNDYYENSDWSRTDYIDPGLVIGIGGAFAAGGIKAYGAIQDHTSGFISTDVYPKMWEETGDPAAVFTMCQSAPMLISMRPNNVFVMKVV